MKILRSVIAACAVVPFVWMFYGPALAGQEQDLQDNRGFIAAKRLEGRWVRVEGG